MNTQELVKATGKLSIVLKDESGQIKDQRDLDNLVVTVGKNFIASRMTGTAANVMSHMAVGTGSTAAAAGDTTLTTEAARVALTTAGGTASSNVVTYSATFPAGTGTAGLQEAGIFNASSAGTLLCHTVFSVVNKGANDSMTISWTITIS
jgi:hypothetical protein